MTAEALEGRTHFAAQPYDWNSVTIKANGFINGVVYNPAAANTFFAHTDMGGAYRWDQATAKWASMTDWAKYNDNSVKQMGVETLAVDPTDAGRVYMSVGTYMSSAAIMRSSDGGRTWARTNVSGINANGNGNARSAGQRMMVDPNSPNILFYGTRDDGLWKSTNSGANWARVTAFPTIGLDSGFSADAGILFVQPDKTSAAPGVATQVWYAGVLDPTAGVPRIYRTLDGGASWAALPGGQPTTANLFPQRMALTPDGSAMYITYSSSTEYGGPYGLTAGRVYKITNLKSATPTWTNVTPDSPYGFTAITLDPTNPNTVYAGEMGNYNPADRIWRSTNGGSTWTALSPNGNRDDSSAPYTTAARVHWLGDLQIDPLNNNVAMFTTGYGIYRTTNLTASNPRWTFFNEGLEQSAVTELASPNDGSVNLISSIGDRDGFRHTDFTQSPSAGVLGRANNLTMGTNTDIDVAFNDSRYVVRVGNTNRMAQYSLDNGVNWAYFGTVPAGATGGGEIAISADGTRAVWDPAGEASLFYSVRNGSTWSAWAPSVADVGDINSAILVADLVEPMTLYAYAGSEVWRSSNGGATFNRMTARAGTVNATSVRAAPGAKGQLYASSYNDGLWQSSDGGATWARVNAAQVNAGYQVAVGAPAPGSSVASLYVTGVVGGVVGFFRSDDRGATWTQINDDAHQYGNLSTIQADPRVYGRLYLGTNGRGILFGDIAGGPPAVPAAASLASVANVTGRSVTLRWTDNATTETGFVVQRSTDGVNWTQVATPAADATSVKLTGLSPLTKYYFRVRAANDVGGSAFTNVAIAQTTAAPTPATIRSFNVNDGATQRSRVTGASIAFTTPVTLAADAISLLRRRDSAVFAVTALNPSGDRMTYVLKFAAAATESGSLFDGIYDLKVTAAGVVDDADQPLDGGDRSYEFYRLFGDIDGNRQVNFNDFLPFQTSFNRTSTSPGFVAGFDSNADERIDFTDFLAFQTRFGRRI
ncbi:MAG TPA: fibronectin type III domain-containing protein [Tepidisphaeraceae bacterium]